MARPIHTNIRVIDEARSVAFYRDAFGMTVKDRLPFDDFTLVFLTGDDSDFELELTVNHGRAEPYSHGTGYGHFAVSEADIEAAHARLSALGLEPTPVKEIFSGGRMAVRFFFVTDPDGYKVEIVHRTGRYL